MPRLTASPFSLSPADLDHVLDRTRDVWEELRGARIFITGGTGFFGMWLMESFLWAAERLNFGARAVVLSRDPAAFQRRAPHIAGHDAVRLHAGDVCGFAAPAGTFSHVVHAATEASARLNEEAPLRMLETIIAGTRRVLDFCVACGATNVLLTSSGAVYGKQPADLSHVAEEFGGAPDPLAPAAAYGEGKRVAELLCEAYRRQHGLAPRIARCFAFVGPYLPLDLHFAVGNFLRDALRGGPIEISGDGTAFRSYLYAADLAVWLWTILVRGQPGRPYNVGSDHAVSILETARAAAELAEDPLQVRVGQTPVPGRPPARYVPSIDRARRELGLDVGIPLPDALRRTLRWHQRSNAVLVN
jgi:dTDP-glucose 4,6-dehydratase